MRLPGGRLAALCTRIVSENFYSSVRPPLVNWSSLAPIKFDAKAQNTKKLLPEQEQRILRAAIAGVQTRPERRSASPENGLEKPEYWL